MKTINLEKISKRAVRNGWLITSLCGLGFLLSLTEPVALFTAIVGLYTGIEEIRLGKQLGTSETPRNLLRRLGRAQLAFSSAIFVYFVVRIATLSSDSVLGFLTPETRNYIMQGEQARAGLIDFVVLITRVTYLIVATIAVCWQLWCARRYFTAASGLTDEAYLRTITFQAKPEEITAIEDLAQSQGISEQQLLRQAMRHYQLVAVHAQRGHTLQWIDAQGRPIRDNLPKITPVK